MKNGSNSDNRGKRKIAAAIKRRYAESKRRQGSGDEYGGTVRRNDRKQPSVAGKAVTTGDEIRTGDIAGPVVGKRDFITEAADNGLGSENPRAGRRAGRQRSDNSSDDSVSDHGEAGPKQAEYTPQDTVRVGKPLKRGRRKKALHIEQAALVGLMAFAFSTIYDICSLFLGKHWVLEDDESTMMASSMDKALSTLPDQYYALIRQNIEKVVPWVAIVVTAIAITYPRITETQRQRRHKEIEVPPQSVNNGVGGFGNSADAIPDRYSDFVSSD
jgi:hypothetical protein